MNSKLTLIVLVTLGSIHAQAQTTDTSRANDIVFEETASDTGYTLIYDSNYVETVLLDDHVLFISGAAQNNGEFIGGAKYRYYLFGLFGAQGDIMFGPEYAHIGVGTIGIIAWQALKAGASNSVPGFILLGGLALTSFEHLSVNIELTKRTYIVPYFSLLRLRGEGEDTFGDMDLSIALGTELDIHVSDRFIVAPYVEYTKPYQVSGGDVNVGLHLGYRIYD